MSTNPTTRPKSHVRDLKLREMLTSALRAFLKTLNSKFLWETVHLMHQKL